MRVLDCSGDCFQFAKTKDDQRACKSEEDHDGEIAHAGIIHNRFLELLIKKKVRVITTRTLLKRSVAEMGSASPPASYQRDEIQKLQDCRYKTGNVGQGSSIEHIINPPPFFIGLDDA